MGPERRRARTVLCRNPIKAGQGNLTLPLACTSQHSVSVHGATRRRVAFIVRGESFRHFSQLRYSLPSVARRRLVCANATWYLQQSLAMNHVRNVILPLERRGWEVDVFLGTYGCWGVLPDKIAQQWHHDLLQWYDAGNPRVRNRGVIRRSGCSTQATPLRSALKDATLKHSAGGYFTVLIWRFDLVAAAPLVGLEPSPLDYLARSTGRVLRVNADYAWSIPGPLLACFVEIMTRKNPSCWRLEGVGRLNAMLCSTLLEKAASQNGVESDYGVGCDPSVIPPPSRRLECSDGSPHQSTLDCERQRSEDRARWAKPYFRKLFVQPGTCPDTWTSILSSPEGLPCSILQGASSMCDLLEAKRDACSLLADHQRASQIASSSAVGRWIVETSARESLRKRRKRAPMPTLADAFMGLQCAHQGTASTPPSPHAKLRLPSSSTHISLLYALLHAFLMRLLRTVYYSQSNITVGT